MAAHKILLVEGISDQYFFFELLRAIGVSAEVKVTPPKEHGASHNNKGGVFTTLPLLIKQLNDGRVDHIAAVVDADHDANHGMGFSKTLQQLTTMLHNEGFTKRERVGEQGGFRFRHQDGLNPIGIWIMPDNNANGGLEEFVLQSVIASEAEALAYAKQILESVPGGISYSEFHNHKAQAAAWMAWQAAPGQGLQQAVKDKLMDMAMPLPLLIVAWLKSIFP